MRLTKGMLDAMLTALCELEAGPGPQGYEEDSPEAERVMDNGAKAQSWIHQEFRRRERKAKARAKGKAERS